MKACKFICHPCLEFRHLTAPGRLVSQAESFHPKTTRGVIEIDSPKVTPEQLTMILKGIRERTMFTEERVVILDEAQRLDIAMRNLLLKELERDQPTWWILCAAAEGAERIECSIRERCQQVYLRKPDPADLCRWARQVCRNEKIEVESEQALKDLIYFTDGSVRQVLQNIDRFALMDMSITSQNIEAILVQ